jgi:putative aldouronate transport system substrate-binding protein
MKRIILLGLLVCAALSMAFAGGQQGRRTAAPASPVNLGPGDPFGRYETPVTVEIGRWVDGNTRYPAGDGPESNQYTRYIKDMLNIDVKVAWAVPDSNQRINLDIASNKIPDALIVNETQLRELIRLDMIEPMTAAIENYAYPLLKEVYYTFNGGKILANVTVNGQIMAMPDTGVQADGYELLWIRKDWLDQYGLTAPKTVEDVKNAARVFVRNGKTGIAGPSQGGALYGTNQSSNYGFDAIFSAFQAFPGFWLEQGGKAVYGSTLPETKTALAELRSMYAEGLIDREMGVRKDSGELIISGSAGIFFAGWSMGYGPLADAIANDPTANWQAYLLPSVKDGKYYQSMGSLSNQYLVVKKGYAHPEALVKMENLLSRDEGQMNAAALPITEWPLRLILVRPDLVEGTAKALRDYLAGKTMEDLRPETEYYGQNLIDDLRTIKNTKLQPYDNMNIQYWDFKGDTALTAWRRAYSMLVSTAPLVDTPYTPVYSITYGQTVTMQRRWANLKKIEDETFLKIILGLEPLSAFDDFVAQWKREGGDQITNEVTALIVN